MYTLKFIFTSVYSKGFPHTGAKGTVTKFDYFIVNTLDSNRIAVLQPLLEKEIITNEDLPELVIEKIVETSDIDMHIQSWQHYDIKINIESFEIKYPLLPIQIWNMCWKTLNNESGYFPEHNYTAYSSLKSEIVNVGESIIRHGTILYSSQVTVEKIEEIIDTLNNKTYFTTQTI